MSDYIIQGDTLTGLGDQVRRITGVSSAFTPAQMISVLSAYSVPAAASYVLGDVDVWKYGSRIELLSPALTELISNDYVHDHPYNYGNSDYENLTEIILPCCSIVGDSVFRGWNFNEIDLPVATSIGFEAFNGVDISAVNIPNVTYVGDEAFHDCHFLSTVNLPLATHIGNYAFQGCSSLSEIRAPLATSIGSGAFSECWSLASVALPEAAFIGSSAFYNCGALTSVSFPLATHIGDGTFFYCDGLSNINLPVATVIGEGAFADCHALTSVTLPAAISIGEYAFCDCSALTSVTLPAATSIESNAFDGCYSLTHFIAPALTSLDFTLSMFSDTLTEVNLQALSVLHSSFFYECSHLASVMLNTACNMGVGTFGYCLYPDDHILSLYLYGSSVGTCASDLFGGIFLGMSSSSSSAGVEGPIPGLSIYVPASLLTEFKTTWASGVYADNIFPHPTA